MFLPSEGGYFRTEETFELDVEHISPTCRLNTSLRLGGKRKREEKEWFTFGRLTKEFALKKSQRSY